MSLKLNDENDTETFFNNLMKGDASVALELTRLASNIEFFFLWCFDYYYYYFEEI